MRELGDPLCTGLMLLLASQRQHLPATCRADRRVDSDTPEIDGIRMNPLVGETGLTVAIALRRNLDIGMAPRSNQLPSTGFALEIDGRIKTEFDTREGAESGAIAGCFVGRQMDGMPSSRSEERSIVFG